MILQIPESRRQKMILESEISPPKLNPLFIQPYKSTDRYLDTQKLIKVEGVVAEKPLNRQLIFKPKLDNEKQQISSHLLIQPFKNEDRFLDTEKYIKAEGKMNPDRSFNNSFHQNINLDTEKFIQAKSNFISEQLNKPNQISVRPFAYAINKQPNPTIKTNQINSPNCLDNKDTDKQSGVDEYYRNDNNKDETNDSRDDSCSSEDDSRHQIVNILILSIFFFKFPLFQPFLFSLFPLSKSFPTYL